MYRLKERVKRGELSPDEALSFIRTHFVGVPPKKLLRWLNGVGKERYAQAKKKGEE